MKECSSIVNYTVAGTGTGTGTGGNHNEVINTNNASNGTATATANGTASNSNDCDDITRIMNHNNSEYNENESTMYDSDSESLWQEIHEHSATGAGAGSSCRNNHHSNVHNKNGTGNKHIGNMISGMTINMNMAGTASQAKQSLHTAYNHASNMIHSAANNVSTLASHGMHRIQQQHQQHNYNEQYTQSNANHTAYKPPRLPFFGETGNTDHIARNNPIHNQHYYGPYSNNYTKYTLGNYNIINHRNNNDQHHNHHNQQQQPSPFEEFGLHTSFTHDTRHDDDGGDGYHHHDEEDAHHQPLLQQQGQHQNAKKFILLDQFRLSPKRDGWGAVANLDLFFASLYNYYYHRGLIPIIGKGITEIISLFFTLWLSVFLFVYVDWKALFQCTDEESCHDFFSNYIIDKPFRHITLYNILIFLYILLFSAYGLFASYSFFRSVKDALQAKFIFEDKLGISAQKLEGGTVEWHQVIRKILQLQQSGEYRIAIRGQDIKDELVIAQRIMRKENFMIAFFNQNLLDLTIPLPWLIGSHHHGRSKMKFYSRSLEWAIYFCVLSYMFNHRYQVLHAFWMDPQALQRRFIVCGIAHAIFMPFLLFFMMLHFSMQNIYDIRSSRQYLGPREWSAVAKWTFREFNELPHIFERRLGPSYQAAEDYLNLFAPSSLSNTIGRILVFLSGSLGAVCIAFAAVNDAILLHVKIGHWNLLWYLGILGVLYSVGKGMLPKITVAERYRRNLFAEMDSALQNVSQHTHYYPEFWKKRGWDTIIKSSFLQLFQYKVQLFAMEILSVILAPVILCFSLPQCAMKICSFVNQSKIEIPGTGDHCGFATFDFDLFEDESWEGQKMNIDDSSSNIPNLSRLGVDVELDSTQRPKAKHGKMEKSFFNFKSAHPEWKCSASGQDLVDRMETFQTEQARALARERQHHITAAARQLEALLAMEEEEPNDNLNPSPLDYTERVNENYIGVKLSTEEIEVNSNKKTDVESQQSKANAVYFKDDTDSPGGREMKHQSSVLRNRANHNHSVGASVVNYADIGGLSTELQNMLNLSTFDSSSSLLLNDLNKSTYQIDNNLEGDSRSDNEKLQEKYMWLEKYHSQPSLQSSSNPSKR